MCVTTACAGLVNKIFAKAEIIKDNGVIKKEGDNMDKWKCMACGFIYDPEIGDPDSGVAPGTPFEKIPEDWSCPICGVGKDSFEKI